MKKPITNARVSRWLLLLEEFDITIVDRIGKDNVVTDFFSWLTINNDDTPNEESFPDENLFVVSNFSPWYTNISNYLVVGRLPLNLSKREKRRIIQQSVRYCWIEGKLFYIGLDLEIRQCVREGWNPQYFEGLPWWPLWGVFWW